MLVAAVLRFFLPGGIPNSEQVASHARSSNHSKTTGDIIGDSFGLLLRSRFLSSFLSSLSAAAAAALLFLLLLLLLPRTLDTRIGI